MTKKNISELLKSITYYLSVFRDIPWNSGDNVYSADYRTQDHSNQVPIQTAENAVFSQSLCDRWVFLLILPYTFSYQNNCNDSGQLNKKKDWAVLIVK